MSDVIKCQYAGDPNDEYCKTCNGVTMLVEGQEYPCTECTAYVPAKDDGEFVNIADEIDEAENTTSEASEQATEDAQTETSTDEATEEATEQPAEAQSDTTVVSTESKTEEDTLPDGVTVKSIRYMSGMTVQKTASNGSAIYYKFTAEEEWAVDEETGKDAEKMQNIREKLWAKVNLEVDTQVGDVFDE